MYGQSISARIPISKIGLLNYKGFKLILSGLGNWVLQLLRPNGRINSSFLDLQRRETKATGILSSDNHWYHYGAHLILSVVWSKGF